MHFHAVTTGLLSAVVETDLSSANITCSFATAAPALGCHVHFGSLPGVSVMRVAGSDVAWKGVVFTEELTPPIMVCVGEILANGNVSSLEFEPVLYVFTGESCIIVCHHGIRRPVLIITVGHQPFADQNGFLATQKQD